MGETQIHTPKPRSNGMSDWVECSCGWESSGYWDGAEYALGEWSIHKADADAGVRR